MAGRMAGSYLVSFQCLFHRLQAKLDYRNEVCHINKSQYLSGTQHSEKTKPGLKPFLESTKLFFSKKIWSKVGVRLIHECGLYTCEYGSCFALIKLVMALMLSIHRSNVFYPI